MPEEGRWLFALDGGPQCLLDLELRRTFLSNPQKSRTLGPRQNQGGGEYARNGPKPRYRSRRGHTATTRPVRSSFPQPTCGPRSACTSALITTQ